MPSKAALASGPRGLGRRLHALRKREQWTLAEMALRTGLAASTLSKVENDQISLGYDSLLKVSSGLGIDISELLSDGPAQQPNGRRILTRRGGGRLLTTANYTYEYLGAELARKRMVTLYTEVKTTSLEAFGPLQKHPGEEFVWVSSGRIAIHTEFYEPVELAAGDSLYFDSMMGHAFIRVGEEQTFIINVISAADDDAALLPAPPAA
ncbi:MAG: helix-turn-helix domain-containing protein [Parvibaculaceae bacterium]